MELVTYFVRKVELASKGAGKWCVYLGVPHPSEELKSKASHKRLISEIKKAVPFLKRKNDAVLELVFGESVYCFFDTEEEARAAYGSVYGDDGSKTNPYQGPLTVYAMLVSPTAGCVSENT